MKFNKMISLDRGLIDSLDKLSLNVSEFCNEKLWDYVTEVEGKAKAIMEKTEDIDKKIIELERKKKVIKKLEGQKEDMIKAGITEDKLKFLRSMPDNIMVAKDMKKQWTKLFNEELRWDDLKQLKKKWEAQND